MDELVKTSWEEMKSIVAETDIFHAFSMTVVGPDTFPVWIDIPNLDSAIIASA